MLIIWAQERTKPERLQHSVRATPKKKKNNFNSSWYQEGISNALTLNSTKQYGSGVYNTAALDDSFPRRFRETFNISGNALKETPTLSLHSPKSKSTTFCYWIRRWLKPPLHVSGYFWIRNIFISNFRPHSSGEFGSESGYFLIHALQSGKKKSATNPMTPAESCPVSHRTINQLL